MEGYLCLGNVRKGTKREQAKAQFHLPDSVGLYFGSPKSAENWERTELSKSQFWGVWVKESEYEASNPNPKLLSTSFTTWWSNFRQTI